MARRGSDRVGVDALPAAIWAAYSRTVFGLMSGYRESWNSPAPPLPLIMARRDISGTALMSYTGIPRVTVFEEARRGCRPRAARPVAACVGSGHHHRPDTARRDVGVAGRRRRLDQPQYVWETSDLIPPCWPSHPHLVHELGVVVDQRRRAGMAFTSDSLLDWHRYCLPSFIDRMKALTAASVRTDTRPLRAPPATRATATPGPRATERPLRHRHHGGHPGCAPVIDHPPVPNHVSRSSTGCSSTPRTGQIADDPDQ